MSPMIVLELVLALTVAAVVVFVAVVVGIHSEPRYQTAPMPRRLLAAMTRRLLGVYVARPGDADTGDSRETCLAGNSAESRDAGGRN